MFAPDFRPELVGRDDELGRLGACLDRAAQGKGCTVFVAGEAGVGKSRLADELCSVARSNGFKILAGSGLFESLTPYMPFMEALRSCDLEYLLAENVPKVEAVYLMSSTGILIKEVLRKETRLDPDLFASMLVTVGEFVKDSMSLLSGKKREGALNSLGYEDYRILIESGADVNLVVVLEGRENELLVEDMRETVQRIGKRYFGVLRDWDGDEAKLAGIEGLLEPLIESGKYDGVFYGRNDPKARRSMLFENVHLGLMRRTRDDPLLLCIDDLQWADPSTLALMHYVARGIGQSRLLILGLYRPEDVVAKDGTAHHVVETMQLMNREGLLEKVELQRLPRQQMPPLLSSLLGKTELGDEFLDRVHDDTEGNPLFVIELMRMMVSEGIIKQDDGCWRLSREPSEILIPSKIRDVIVRRLDKVPKEERRVLDYASVVGDSFTSSVISQALQIKKVVLLERLRTLADNHKLIHPHDDKWRFDHSKIKEVLYGQIPEELRREYHSIIANSIEELNDGKLDEVVGDLAFHYYRCRNKAQALRFLILAARKARNDYSNAEAVRFYSEALELEDDAKSRVGLLEDLGAIYELIGRYEKSVESYESAEGAAKEKCKKAELKAKIASVLCSRGEHEKCFRVCSEALELLGTEQTREKSSVLRIMGNVSSSKGDYENALGHYENALIIAKATGDDAGIMHALLGIGGAWTHKGLLDRALEAFQQALGVSRGIGDLRFIARCLGNIGALQYHKGEVDEARKHYEESLGIFERIGDKQGMAYLVNNLGVLHENRGQYDKALEYYEKSLSAARRIGDKAILAASMHNVGAAYQFMKKYDESVKYYTEGLRISEQIGHQIGIAYNCCGIAEAHAYLGEWKQAIEFCDRAFQVSRDAGLKQYQALAKRIYGMVYREQGMWKKSIENFDESLRILEEIHLERNLADVNFEFGLMWKKKGDVDKAKAHLLKAMEIFRRIKADTELAKAERAFEGLDGA